MEAWVQGTGGKHHSGTVVLGGSSLPGTTFLPWLASLGRLFGPKPFWIDFLSIFLANMAPSWAPKSIKILEKSMPRGLPKLSSILDRFSIDFGCQLRSPNSSISCFFSNQKRCFFKKSPLEDNIDFYSILDANMPPFCFQDPQKSFKNLILRGIKILIVFCFDF